MARNTRSVFLTGIMLVILGVALSIAATSGSSRIIGLIPFSAGIVICVAGKLTDVPGMYLPGVVIAGAGAGVALLAFGVVAADERMITGVLLAGIGAGVGLLPILSKLSGWDLVIWPLPPAGALVLFGVGLLASPESSRLYGFFSRGWPVAAAFSVAWLIVLLFRRRGP